MKNLYRLLIVVPFLFSCTKRQYTGPKLHVEYNESGALIEVLPDDMFERAFTNKIDSIYYIGDDSCTACQKLKPQLNAWCEVNHGAIYYIPLNTITDENEHYIVDSTVGYYCWEDKKVVPTVYFFMQGEVILGGDSSNTMKFLIEKVEVNTGDLS